MQAKKTSNKYFLHIAHLIFLLLPFRNLTWIPQNLNIVLNISNVKYKQFYFEFEQKKDCFIIRKQTHIYLLLLLQIQTQTLALALQNLNITWVSFVELRGKIYGQKKVAIVNVLNVLTLFVQWLGLIHFLKDSSFNNFRGSF